MNVSPFLSVNHSCDAAMPWVREQLFQAGLHPVETFDLHTAREGLHDCPCPNHGTNECDCQLVVMLVYGGTGDGTAFPTVINTSPVTLILHGNDGQTWLSISDPSMQQNDAGVLDLIRRALEGHVPAPIHHRI